jgi:hypothetical protein
VLEAEGWTAKIFEMLCWQYNFCHIGWWQCTIGVGSHQRAILLWGRLPGPGSLDWALGRTLGWCRHPWSSEPVVLFCENHRRTHWHFVHLGRTLWFWVRSLKSGFCFSGKSQWWTHWRTSGMSHYESLRSKTRSLSFQNLLTFFIDWLIHWLIDNLDRGKVFPNWERVKSKY